MENFPGTNLKTLWEQTVAPLRARLDREEYQTWIEPLKPVAVGDGVLELAVPNRMFATWVEENFLAELSTAWVSASGKDSRLRFTWEPGATQGELFPVPARQQQPEEAPPARARRPAGRPGGLIARYEFASYVVGPSNQFARAAGFAVARQPGTLYNPFFLFGGVGLGKTHLVNAVGNAILDDNPSARVLFLSADTFTNRLIDAIGRNKVQEFKNRMRRIDVVILDDVQFLAGRERTQQEFFHIFNALYESGRQIILTSDKFPNEIQGLEERLCNRFGWGLVADIKAPDEETRAAILGRKAKEEGLEVDRAVLAFIAARFETNIRDLEGALTRLSAWASLNRCDITVELAERLLGSPDSANSRSLTFEEIETRITSHFGLKPGELKARKRTRKVAEARQVAMFLMRHHTGASFPMIGEFLGGRDHSTVVHGCQAVRKRAERETGFRKMLDTLARSLGCG
ncbi:MAG: chromosomal replication initiator protein DnaA [Candidatus Binatia bacterium]